MSVAVPRMQILEHSSGGITK